MKKLKCIQAIYRVVACRIYLYCEGHFFQISLTDRATFCLYI